MNSRSPLLALSFLILLTASAGCASRPPTPKELNRPVIERVNRVEIFYTPEEHRVIHQFGNNLGTGVVGAGSWFGAVGTLVGLGVAIAASRSALDEAAPRSAAFNAAVKATATGDMNTEAAQHLAQQFEQMGKTVKLTQVSRLPGRKPGMMPELPPPQTGAAYIDPQNAGAQPDQPEWKEPLRAPEVATTGFAPTPGYAPVLLRVTTGYGSPDVLVDFRSVAIVEYALVDPETRNYLVDGQFSSVNEPEGPSYFSWSALLQDAAAARAQLRRSLLQTADPVAASIFAFDKR